MKETLYKLGECVNNNKGAYIGRIKSIEHREYTIRNHSTKKLQKWNEDQIKSAHGYWKTLDNEKDTNNKYMKEETIEVNKVWFEGLVKLADKLDADKLPQDKCYNQHLHAYLPQLLGYINSAKYILDK